MSWGETAALTRVLADDPTSQVAAAVRSLTHPLSREGFILTDLYELLLAANWTAKHKKPKPYPRPTDAPPPKFGDVGRWSQAEVRALLASRGHGRAVTPPAPPGPRRDARGRFCRAP